MTSSNETSVDLPPLDVVDRYLVLSDVTRDGWTTQHLTLKHPDDADGVVIAEGTSLTHCRKHIKGILSDLIRDPGGR